MKYKAILLTTLLAALLLSGCQKFVFFDVSVPEDRNPLLISKVPTTEADVYFNETTRLLIDKNRQPGPNLDEGGALDNWATCLVMIKEGHDHGQGKLHGNYVYPNAPWKQEQFAVIRNTTSGITVEVDRRSTATFLEATANKELQEKQGVGPDYLRVVGGQKRLWGLCFYFYNKDGKLINDNIYEHSDQYQIFFSISDLDDKGQPYDVMDVRFRNGVSDENYRNQNYKPMPLNMEAYKNEQPIPSEYFQNRKTFEERREVSRTIFRYTYRDTWTQDDMADGVRTLYNIRLLPPTLRSEYFLASCPQDQDNVGLKGHLEFDYRGGIEKVLDDREPMIEDFDGLLHNAYKHDEAVDQRKWPLLLAPRHKTDNEGKEILDENGKPQLLPAEEYTRIGGSTNLLPQFYLAVRVMKCEKGRKLVLPSRDESYSINNKPPRTGYICQEFDNPKMEASGWQEVVRFNIPIKVYTSGFDSDPANTNEQEPYYLHLGREIGLTPAEAFQAVANLKTHGAAGTGGNGYGAWFL